MCEIKKITDEELIKSLSSEERTIFHKIGHSYVAIRQLIDFMKVLRKNEEDYEDEINIRTCKETNIHPSEMLSLYIILEAYSFYETFKFIKSKIKDLPKIPPYLPKLELVRNKIIAHKDTKEELPLVRDSLSLISELDKEAPLYKIIQDVEERYSEIKNYLNKSLPN